MKEKRAKTLCPRLGQEVPDTILPDIGHQPSHPLSTPVSVNSLVWKRLDPEFFNVAFFASRLVATVVALPFH